jgi:hypothetical protein
MSQVIPQGELLRQAAAFVAETRKERPSRSLESVLDEAGMRFNLTPLDCEGLRRLFAGASRENGAA